MAKNTKAKSRTFHIQLHIPDAYLAYDIVADSLEEALAQAKAANYNTVFDREPLEWVDGTPEVVGIYT